MAWGPSPNFSRTCPVRVRPEFGLVLPLSGFPQNPALSMTVGVTNNPDSIPPVRRIEGASWNNKRLDFIALAFQVKTHLFELHVDDTSNILANNPSGPGF